VAGSSRGTDDTRGQGAVTVTVDPHKTAANQPRASVARQSALDLSPRRTYAEEVHSMGGHRANGPAPATGG